MRAAEEFGCQAIILGGGVTQNKRLRALYTELAPDLSVYWPGPGLSLDNAAMIAGLGFHIAQERPEGDTLDLDAATRLSIARAIPT